MSKIGLLISLLLFSSLLKAQVSDTNSFEMLDQSKDWQLKFSDDCTENWKSKWFLDGLRATIDNTKDGMVFSAGSVEGDDACHAVLWTKDSFEGDVKIEYTYTRTDTQTKWVNIVYIQASGVEPYSSDITEWNELRRIPSMKTYFTNMKALHISYAAFNNDNLDEKNDYVRARQYPVLPENDFTATTEIPPASFKTGLFLPGETYTITIIKASDVLYFNVEGKNKSKVFFWKLSDREPVSKGRIGLRHMYTRSARYKDFNIYIKE